MAARWKHLKIFKLMRKLLPPLSHDKRWCKVCSWWVLIHSCVYISLILFCFQTHYWSIDQAIRRDKNWMLPALTILNALSSCLADADSSVSPNFGQATTFFFLMLSIVCSILNFILVNLLGRNRPSRLTSMVTIGVVYPWTHGTKGGHLYLLRNWKFWFVTKWWV